MTVFAAPEATKVTPVKVASAYRTISEAAELLSVPQHVLRFWETKFPQIRPMKRSGGRRYYRPEDIETLRMIQGLLYQEGYTIKGVQRLLRMRRGVALQTLDDSTLDAGLFDGDAVAEALMLNMPQPQMPNVDLGIDDVVADVIEAAADVIQAQSFEIDIPAHLPPKPAALMAAGLEAGRPFPEPTAVAAPEAVAVEMGTEPQPLTLSASQRLRVEELLGELKQLKTLLAN